MYSGILSRWRNLVPEWAANRRPHWKISAVRVGSPAQGLITNTWEFIRTWPEKASTTSRQWRSLPTTMCPKARREFQADCRSIRRALEAYEVLSRRPLFIKKHIFSHSDVCCHCDLIWQVLRPMAGAAQALSCLGGFPRKLSHAASRFKKKTVSSIQKRHIREYGLHTSLLSSSYIRNTPINFTNWYITHPYLIRSIPFFVTS